MKTLLKPQKRNDYFEVTLCTTINDNTIPQIFTVHKLLMLTFVGKRTDDYIINHKDCNKLNNNLSNLEYCTYSENARHARENNLVKSYTKKIAKLDANGNIIKTYNSRLEAVEAEKIANSTIGAHLRSHKNGISGYRWKYVDEYNPIEYQSKYQESESKIYPNYPNYRIYPDGHVYLYSTRQNLD
jgi:hypothetical protein